MEFIKNNKNKIGNWTITKINHSSFCGTFTVGSLVKIVDIDPIRGYAIEDVAGNRIRGIGWVI